MDPQQYSLSWNHFHSNLVNGFHSLFKDQDMVDVTLAVDGNFFQAHKLVLSVCSPYFKELFHANPCKHPIVLLQDVPEKILNCMLMFMYQGEVQVAQNDLAPFLKLADFLRVKGLSESDVQGQAQTGGNRETADNNQDPTTNGALPFTNKVEAQLATYRPIRPKISPVKIDTLRAGPSSPPASTSTPNTATIHKRRKPDDAHNPPDAGEAKKSKNASLLALRMDDLQSNSKKIVAHNLFQKQAAKQNNALPEIPAEPVVAVSQTNNQIVSSVLNSSLLIAVKEEPLEIDNTNESMGHTIFDMGSIVTTTLGEVGSSPAVAERGQTTDDLDSAGPGGVMILKSRRGLPVLIHDGHIYTKHKVEPTRTLWLCVKQRNLQCGGCLCTGTTEQHVLSFCGHNHRRLHDIIKRLQTSDAAAAMGSGSSNCGSSSNSSPSHDKHDFHLEPTDLSVTPSDNSYLNFHKSNE